MLTRVRFVCSTALASVSAVLACTGPVFAPEPEPPPSWLSAAPVGCAIGFSGPTLNPGDAIRYSRQAALHQLAADDREALVRVQSELYVSGNDSQRGGEFSRQDIEGRVRDAQITAMWAELTVDLRSTTRVRHVYAMACREDQTPPGVPNPPFPSWVLNVPERDGEICALGVGGPTYDPRDQEPGTLRDGRQALAQALESRLHQIIIDTGRGSPRVASELATTDAALQRASAAEELDEQWSDREGVGPLGLRGVLYGLVCVAG